MPAGVSLSQMLKVPYIIGTLRRYHAPGATISQYYGLGMNPSTNVQRIVGNAGQYDIFDGTRSLAPVSARQAPPTDLNRKPIGSVPITVPRLYTKIGIYEDEIFGMRDVGSPYNQPVPSRGIRYFNEQVGYLKQRGMNNQEFMAAKMFAGGWKLKPVNTLGGQGLVLADSDDATAGSILNDTKVPADHKGQIDGIIDVSWDNANANIVNQFMELNKRAARVNGRRITNVWLNGTTAKHLFTNNVIQAVGGSVYRIFDTLNPAQQIAPNQKFPDTGVTVVFRGLPDIKFHIYNQGYVVPGTSESFEDQTSADNWKPFIPDNYAIMTPDPGQWCGMVEGSELIRWNLRQARSQLVYGLGMGVEEAIDPPRQDVKMLYNGAPVITEPYAVYYAEVIFS